MKISTYLFTLILVLSFLTVSCRKDDDVKTNKETEAENTVTVNLSTNAVNDTIASGAELHITGTVVGTQEMHGYGLVLKNMMTDCILFETSEHDHADNYNIHGHWVNNLQNNTGLHLTLTVEKDHEGHTVTKEIHLVGKGQ